VWEEVAGDTDSSCGVADRRRIPYGGRQPHMTNPCHRQPLPTRAQSIRSFICSPFSDILCSLMRHLERAAYKAADGLGACGKRLPVTRIRHHAATNSKPFASTWAPGRGPRAREKSGDGWISPKLNLVVVSPSSPLTTKFNLGLIQPSPDFSLALGPLPGAHVSAR
jgi:hypothetical protein